MLLEQATRTSHSPRRCCSGNPTTCPQAERISFRTQASERRPTMKPRMNFFQAAPDTIKALNALEAQVQASGLEQSLIELVKTRASEITGCPFCINMHTQDARKHGETEPRLYLLNPGREAPLYSDRERDALTFNEAVTFI